MECPFCAEEIKDEALVCKHCSRDLKIPKPLIEENRQLIATIGELRLELDRLKAEVTRRKSPAVFWAKHLAVYIVPPIVLLLVAHVLLIVVLDKNPLIMRIVAMLIPLPFGFALAWLAHLGWRTATGIGVLIGVVAVAGMTAIIGYIDDIPILREWRETAEYAVSIALAFLTGNILATIARNILSKHAAAQKQPSAVAMRLATVMAPHVGKPALRRRAEKIDGLVKTFGPLSAALGSAAGTIYTGVRALIGA